MVVACRGTAGLVGGAAPAAFPAVSAEPTWSPVILMGNGHGGKGLAKKKLCTQGYSRLD